MTQAKKLWNELIQTYKKFTVHLCWLNVRIKRQTISVKTYVPWEMTGDILNPGTTDWKAVKFQREDWSSIFRSVVYKYTVDCLFKELLSS